jgi:hypothetical protein
MKKPVIRARVAYLLAAIGFMIAGWREHGLIVPLAGVALAVILVLIARRRARRRRVRVEKLQVM